MDETSINEVNALGDVEFDQDIDTDSVIAAGGGLAVNGDLDDSAANTGINTGIVAGDDADLTDSIVGDGNVQFNDSSAGAAAFGGDATNAVGDNVNLGSGTLVDTQAAGDAQVVAGDGNEVQGDVNVAAAGVDGPLNLAIGDQNAQQGLEDNSTTIEDSFNTDASINDSGNTAIADSFNTELQDNDTETTVIDDSFNQSLQDNDLTTVDIQETFETNEFFQDNDTLQTVNDTDLEEIQVLGDGNDIDLPE